MGLIKRLTKIDDDIVDDLFVIYDESMQQLGRNFDSNDAMRESYKEFLADFITRDNQVVLVEYIDEIPVAALRAIENKQGKWFIEAVEVNPDYRHRGYGKMLLQDTLSFLKNKKASIVECIILKENEISKRLHSSCGFLSTTDEPINCWDELEEDSVLYRLVM